MKPLITIILEIIEITLTPFLILVLFACGNYAFTHQFIDNSLEIFFYAFCLYVLVDFFRLKYKEIKNEVVDQILKEKDEDKN